MNEYEFKVGERVKVNMSRYRESSPGLYKYWHNSIVKITYVGYDSVYLDKPSFWGGGVACMDIQYIEPLKNYQFMLFEL